MLPCCLLTWHCRQMGTSAKSVRASRRHGGGGGGEEGEEREEGAAERAAEQAWLRCVHGRRERQETLAADTLTCNRRGDAPPQEKKSKEDDGAPKKVRTAVLRRAARHLAESACAVCAALPPRRCLIRRFAVRRTRWNTACV